MENVTTLNVQCIFLPRATEERHQNREAMYAWGPELDSKRLIIITDYQKL